MAIEPGEVRRVAELARLELRDDEVVVLARELSAVLDFAASLGRLDLEGAEPSVLAPADALLREDRVDDRRLTPEQATAGAPEAEDGFFIVPPIIENIQP